MTNLVLLLAALVAAPSPAQDDAPPPKLVEIAPARSAPGWVKQPTSLLLYGEDGGLAAELPLQDAEFSGPHSHEVVGGVSPDARIAWTLDRRQTWNQDRTKLLESRRSFKTYGTSGQELWRDDSVDLPERGDPIQFSADGKTLLLARRTTDGWTAEARTWLGQPLLAIGPFPRLVSIALTPNGRFALVHWNVLDKSDTHTFLDLETKRRKDVPSSDLLLGLARIGDDGVVRSGPRVVFSFEVAASTPTVATSTAAPAASSAPAVSNPTPPAQ